MIYKMLLFVIIGLTSTLAEAQFIKQKSVNAQIGFGLSSPYNSNDDVVDDGFFAQGEFILKVKSWFELRPYAAVILTSTGGEDLNGNPTDETATSRAFLLGGKVRLKAPIPFVAPYIESGIGTSIGKFETFTAFDNIDKSGIIYHIPVSIGFEFGKNNDVDLGLSYFFQPTVKQYAGAFAIGISFPLND